MTVKHPAKFSPNILHRIGELVDEHAPRHRGMKTIVLDPFAGIGLIHLLEMGREQWLRTFAVELEFEWCEQAQDRGPTHCGDFLKFRPLDASWFMSHFDVVATSCTYGNRMADHHDARDDSTRNTYKHTLGRDLSPGSSCTLQWGEEYRDFHEQAWHKVRELLTPEGIFILNVSDHIRTKRGVKRQQPVAKWHRTFIQSLGFELITDELIPTKRNRQGANGNVRVDGEHIYVFRKVAR